MQCGARSSGTQAGAGNSVATPAAPKAVVVVGGGGGGGDDVAGGEERVEDDGDVDEVLVAAFQSNYNSLTAQQQFQQHELHH